jgi:ABC-type branched-subunit amino acid transport system substrate-binding protein
MSAGIGRTTRMLGALAAVAIAAAACSSSGSTAAPEATTGATTAPVASDAGGGGATQAPPTGEAVAVCELAYYTGEFAPYGPALTADVVFPIKEVINLDPPLGRTWETYHEDLGTVGEAQAARTCLEKHGAEVLVSIAHGYRTYRDFMMDYWQENDSPLGPSVHGGAIPGNLGGKGAEPIFRAQGLDQGLGTFGSLYAQSIGAKKVVIFATQVEGFQAAADAAEESAKLLGLEVLARIDEQPEQPSYAAVAQKIADLNPDAVIMQAGSVESATLIKQAAEKGISLNWIGETGWSQAEFMNTLGTAPIASQKGIGYTNFSPNTTTPAWTFYQPLRDDWVAKSGVDPTTYYGADNPYAYSTYDLLVQTALAVEAAGSYKASEWAPAMFKVGDGPGEICYTYADCLALIRAGKDIDYEGVTGPGTYTEGGVNAITPSYTPYGADGKAGAPVLLDANLYLDILDQIKTVAKCDPENPPNKCEW